MRKQGREVHSTSAHSWARGAAASVRAPSLNVSIVTPSLNQGQFIEATILSVCNQDYPHIEHLVMDGGSTDGTLDILRQYEDAVFWISEPDEGQSDAINKGLRRAHGDILAYLNADDTYTPGAVATAVGCFEANPDVDMVYGDCNIIDEHSRVVEVIRTKDFDLADLLRTNPIPQPTVFFRRRVLDAVGFFDAHLHYAMDYDYWVRVARQHRIRRIPEVLANFRMYRESKSVSQLDGFYGELVKVFDRAARNPRMARYLPPSPTQREGLAHYNLGVAYYGRGQMVHARQHLVQAARLYPHLLVGRSLLLFLAKSLLGARLTKTLRHWIHMAAGR